MLKTTGMQNDKRSHEKIMVSSGLSHLEVFGCQKQEMEWDGSPRTEIEHPDLTLYIDLGSVWGLIG